MRTKRESLGILGIEALHYYVHDLERTRRFLVDKLDFTVIGASGAALDREGQSHSVAVQAGESILVLIEPRGQGGRAARYLKTHPEGVGTIVMHVKDIDHCFKLFEERGGTPMHDIQRHDDARGGKLAMFSATTPFGDTTIRFVQRDGYSDLFPGFVRDEAARPEAHNRFKFRHFDHLTANFRTMGPGLLWMEHVLGFERFWTVQFHTAEVATTDGAARTSGSGLKSIVMFDPESGVKFANNEPCRPFFRKSQIALFTDDNVGDGIQHAALSVDDIIPTVREMRGAGVEFMPTPHTYFDALPARLKDIGVNKIDESIDTLRDLQILVDGGADHSYMLQIFLKDAAGLHKDPVAGPFFFEIIQRKGDKGFGAGNFRALFESIERQQQTERQV